VGKQPRRREEGRYGFRCALAVIGEAVLIGLGTAPVRRTRRRFDSLPKPWGSGSRAFGTEPVGFPGPKRRSGGTALPPPGGQFSPCNVAL
jgi:hypothetical protein